MADFFPSMDREQKTRFAIYMSILAIVGLTGVGSLAVKAYKDAQDVKERVKVIERRIVTVEHDQSDTAKTVSTSKLTPEDRRALREFLAQQDAADKAPVAIAKPQSGSTSGTKPRPEVTSPTPSGTGTKPPVTVTTDPIPPTPQPPTPKPPVVGPIINPPPAGCASIVCTPPPPQPGAPPPIIGPVCTPLACVGPVSVAPITGPLLGPILAPLAPLTNRLGLAPITGALGG